MFLWEIYIASNNKTHLGLQENCPIFLLNFNRSWNFS